MAEIQQPTTDVAVIKNALPTLTNLPAVLLQHQASVSGATAAITTLVAKCEAGDVMTEELDDECKKMIIKVNMTVEKMEGNRKPGTQIMTEIAKMFTTLEGSLKPLVAKLQEFRNQRAREVAENNRRLEREAKEKAEKDKDIADAVAYYTRAIAGCLNKKLHDRKLELNTLFDSLSLDDIDKRGEGLRSLINQFPAAKLDIILVYSPSRATARLSDAEIAGVEAKVRGAYDFDTFYITYQQELDEVKNALVDRLPSKKTELLEKKAAADRQEQLRQEQERQRLENERIAEEQRKTQNLQRQQELEQQRVANEQRQEQLRLEQEKQRLEQERLDLEAEQLRQEQQTQLDDQNRLKQEQLDKEAELTRAGAQGQILFEAVNTVNQKEAEGEVRKGWKIVVTHMAGWAEIWQFWYLANAASTPLDKFEKMTLLQMKTFAEGKGDTEKISSKYLTYEETITAVNRKEKAKKSTV